MTDRRKCYAHFINLAFCKFDVKCKDLRECMLATTERYKKLAEG